jgi:hypothetical protein
MLAGSVSSVVNPRPRWTREPRSGRKRSETNAPISRSGSPVPVKFTLWPRQTAMSAKERLCSRQSTNSGHEAALWGTPGSVAQTITRRPGSAKGRGRSRVASTTLNMAVVPPTPRAMVSAATTANPGRSTSVRTA